MKLTAAAALPPHTPLFRAGWACPAGRAREGMPPDKHVEGAELGESSGRGRRADCGADHVASAHTNRDRCGEGLRLPSSVSSRRYYFLAAQV